MEPHPDIYFSETEFEQAGLLHDTDSCTVASPSGFHDGGVSGSERQQLCDTLHSLPTSSCGLADRLQILSHCWQVYWPGQAPSSPILPKGTMTPFSSLGEDVAMQIPPVPEESLQRTSVVAQNEQPRSMPIGLAADVIRKQANRDHQKRFRMRRKVRFQDVLRRAVFSTPQPDICTCCLKHARVALCIPPVKQRSWTNGICIVH